MLRKLCTSSEYVLAAVMCLKREVTLPNYLKTQFSAQK